MAPLLLEATQTFFYYKLGGKGINIAVNPQPALTPTATGNSTTG